MVAGWMERQRDRQIDGWMDGPRDRWLMDRQMDGCLDEIKFIYNLMIYFILCMICFSQPTIADFLNVAWWTSAAAW